MNLINDLGNELAVAFLIEKKYRQKMDSRAAVDLIDRVKTTLSGTDDHEAEPCLSGSFEPAIRAASH